MDGIEYIGIFWVNTFIKAVCPATYKMDMIIAAIRRLLLSSNLYVTAVIIRNTRIVPAFSPETIRLSTPNCD